MSTVRGREAFFTVKELGPDGEWSFGFPRGTVKTSKLTDEWKERGAKRLLAGIDPVEASPVFRGAGIGTMTMHTKADDSLSDRMNAVHEALFARNRALPEGDTETPHWWAREVFEDHVIVEAGTQLLRIEYAVDDEGVVTLGATTEVEVVYQAVEEKAAELVEETKADEPEELELDLGPEEAYKVKAALALDEFQRVQRTLRRLGVA
jgi:hypothetical protein